jgi:hypothetical protein
MTGGVWPEIGLDGREREGMDDRLLMRSRFAQSSVGGITDTGGSFFVLYSFLLCFCLHRDTMNLLPRSDDDGRHPIELFHTRRTA